MRFLERAAIAFAVVALSLPARAAYHTYQIDELYSNADGTVQYVVLHESLGANGENMLGGHTLTATHGATTRTYTFARDLPGGTCEYSGYSYSCMAAPTAGTSVLIATDGFAALGLVTPDYVVRNGFLPMDGGTVNYAGVDQLTYAALPTDGVMALYRDGTTKPNRAVNFAGASASVSLSPPTLNFQGLWWGGGSTEDGWGINFAHSGDLLFATWYTYDTSGKAFWLSMLANRAPGTNSFSGALLVDTGPPFNNFDRNAVAAPPVGNGSVTFSDANHGTFAYTINAGTGGSAAPVSQPGKPIVRYDLATGPQPSCVFDATANLALASNYQDLWWKADQSEQGWGVNFAHQGDAIFATWYTYDTSGQPLWLAALATRVPGTNQYSGSIYRKAGPRFDAYVGPPASMIVLGNVTLTFTSGNGADFHYATDGKGGLPIVDQHKTIARYPFTASGGTLCR